MSRRLEPLQQRLVLMSPSQAPLPHAIDRPSQPTNSDGTRQNSPVPISKSRCPRQELACTTRKIRRTHEEIANTCRSIANTRQELERLVARERRVRVRKIPRRAGHFPHVSEFSEFAAISRPLLAPRLRRPLRSSLPLKANTRVGFAAMSFRTLFDCVAAESRHGLFL